MNGLRARVPFHMSRHTAHKAAHTNFRRHQITHIDQLIWDMWTSWNMRLHLLKQGGVPQSLRVPDKWLSSRVRKCPKRTFFLFYAFFWWRCLKSGDQSVIKKAALSILTNKGSSHQWHLLCFNSIFSENQCRISIFAKISCKFENVRIDYSSLTLKSVTIRCLSMDLFHHYLSSPSCKTYSLSVMNFFDNCDLSS